MNWRPIRGWTRLLHEREMKADSMPERLLIGPGSPPSLDPVYPELSPSPEPCHTTSFAGIAGCRNSRNLYFFLPRARPVPVKSGVDGGPPRSTEVVLNAWGVGREASMTGLSVISEGHENLMIRSLASPGPPQSRVSWAKPPPPREMPSKTFSLRNLFHLNEAI